ncbi:dihydrofolate reductase-like isoform X8 [Dreissena polymorpha]|nr:dihydrofolate reductase-like isoform X8 [Dreissena polymorpha]
MCLRNIGILFNGSFMYYTVKGQCDALLKSLSLAHGHHGTKCLHHERADFEYYLKTTSTHKKDSSLMIVHVHGRKSWAGCTDFQASYGGVYHIVCSQSRDPSIKTHPNLLTVAGSVPEALEYIADLNRNGKLDSVWVMGGAGIYQECLSHPLCGRIYLTHVYKDFPSDTFFPPFDDDFREVK